MQIPKSGGCQCGAIRFRVSGALGRASICHCRMCQKAFGAFYAPLVSIKPGTLGWTRGELTHFQSSNFVKRGFCAACGTPLTYEAPDGLAIAIGAFDDPSDLDPKIEYGCESKLPWVDSLSALPGNETMDNVGEAAFLAEMVSFQHPDHDT